MKNYNTNRNKKPIRIYSKISKSSIKFPLVPQRRNIQTTTMRTSYTNYNDTVSTSINNQSSTFTFDSSRPFSAHKNEHTLNTDKQYIYVNHFFSFEPNEKQMIHKKNNFTFVKRPKLLRNTKENLKTLLNKENTTKRKVKRKPLHNSQILQEKLQNLIDNKINCLKEANDKISMFDFDYIRLHKTIRKHLINDINPMTILLKEKDVFYQKKENRVNFIYDIFKYPHLENVFMFNYHEEDKEGKNKELLVSPNCLSQITQSSMNKLRRKAIFIKNYETTKKEDFSVYFGDFNKIKENEREENVKRVKYDFEQFFDKARNYHHVGFANRKDTHFCNSILSLSRANKLIL